MFLWRSCVIFLFVQVIYANKFLRRDNSLVAPYTGAWHTIGSTIITPNLVRLTTDSPSLRGGIVNYHPLDSRDWEVHINFKVHGSTGAMFGDGFAFWYTDGGVRPGPALGGQAKFRGLGVFFDTYNNQQSDISSHSFPYISAMVNDGDAEFDSGTDGTKTQIAGCPVSFRNQADFTVAIIRYTQNTLEVLTETGHSGNPTRCFKVENVYLPTGYVIGLTAETGDLSDNHDILYLKTYELDVHYSAEELLEDRSKIKPTVLNRVAPPEVEPVVGSSIWWSIGKFILYVSLAGGLFCGLYLCYSLYQSRQSRRKRLF